MDKRSVLPRRKAIAVAFGLGFLLCVGAAVATPGMGVVGTFHASGTTDGRIDVSSDAGIKLKTRRSIGVATQQIVIAGGGHTGWHSHPGPVIVTVKTGTLRLIYADDCTGLGTVYEAGDTFVDRGDENVHIARNESLTSEVVLWATYLAPAGTALPDLRINADAPDPADCDDDDDDDDDDDEDDDDD